MWEAGLVGKAAIREQPVDLVTDGMVTLLDTIVVAVGRVVLSLQHVFWWVVEELCHVLVKNRPIGLQGQQVKCGERGE